MFWERSLVSEMNRRRRWLWILILSACSIGACSQKPARDPARELENEAARREGEASHKYRFGDYETAKSALRDLLQFLDKAGYPPNAPDEYRVDAMITCLRLAKLEEKQGHAAEQAAYLKEAVTRCQTMKLYPKCEEAGLRKEVDRLDALIK